MPEPAVSPPEPAPPEPAPAPMPEPKPIFAPAAPPPPPWKPVELAPPLAPEPAAVLAPAAPGPPTPTPAPPTVAAPHWAREPAATADLDEWIRRGTLRRGNPVAAAVGWIVGVAGLFLLAYTYYFGYTNGTAFAPAGVRGDYLAAAVLVIGLGVSILFSFLPARRAAGLGPDAQSPEIEAALRRSAHQVQAAQIVVAVGLSLAALGAVWIAYWLRLAEADGALRQSSIAGVAFPTHFLGSPFVVVGLVLACFGWGRVGAARRGLNQAVVALLRALGGGPSRPPSALPSGVTEEDVRKLMRRVDGLMAQLPDAAVTDFSKTPEADTYLKLLGP